MFPPILNMSGGETEKGMILPLPITIITADNFSQAELMGMEGYIIPISSLG